jgi:hypothetical protein
LAECTASGCGPRNVGGWSFIYPIGKLIRNDPRRIFRGSGTMERGMIQLTDPTNIYSNFTFQVRTDKTQMNLLKPSFYVFPYILPLLLPKGCRLLCRKIIQHLIHTICNHLVNIRIVIQRIEKLVPFLHMFRRHRRNAILECRRFRIRNVNPRFSPHFRMLS